MHTQTDTQRQAQVPYAFDDVWLRADAVESLWQHDTCLCHTQVRQRDGTMTVFDCSLISADGCVVMHMKGVYARSIEAGAVHMGSAEAMSTPDCDLSAL